MNRPPATLVAIVGPTGAGKSDTAIEVAEALSAPIISFDSRQFFKEMSIGTAVPTKEQLAQVKHYFIQNKSVEEHYTCGKFEHDAIELLEQLFANNSYVVMCGGSGLYLDAVLKGFDELPTIDLSVREALNTAHTEAGIAPLLQELKQSDPQYFDIVDRQNPQRVIRALEVCRTTGLPYSSFRQQKAKERNFNSIIIGITSKREELYSRINLRVDKMVEAGLEEEAKRLQPLKELNALQSVGYREFFDYFDNKTTHTEAIELIKRNSRRYAKRQLTWFTNRYPEAQWFEPMQTQQIVEVIRNK